MSTKKNPTHKAASPALTLTVEAAVPMPSASRSGTVYPFDKMDIGDSFAAPYTSPEEMHRLRGRFTSVCRTYVNQQAKLGATVAFTIRNVADKKEVRVWKVAPKLPTAEEVSQALA